MLRRTTPVVALAAASLALASCTSTSSTSSSPAPTSAGQGSAATSAMPTAMSSGMPTAMSSGMPTAMSSGSMSMGHSMDGGPAPAGMTPAPNAKYPVGTKVILTADHMPGMKGATATVVGVYSTITYAVTYTPTTGGPQVVDHKWVVQEELSGVGTQRLANGTTVTIEADHMVGMKGAKGVVVSSTTEPVYMVDYTTAGMTIKNHKWVVQSEMQPLA